MKCPKCHATVTATPDATGYFNCTGCGIKLKVPAKSEQTKTARVTRPQFEGPATLVPNPRPARPSAPAAPVVTPAAIAPGQFEALLTEIREVRRLQELMLEKLDARPVAAFSAQRAAAADDIETVDADDLAAPSPVGADVLLVDDDATTRAAAEQALRASGVAVRVVSDGSKVLEAIAQRLPSALVLEAELGGAMPARDLIDRIKATMEWVNIPIVLFTRREITAEHEMRTQFGADAYVAKGPGAEVVLAGRVQEVINR